jgi:hypothetical protein
MSDRSDRIEKASEAALESGENFQNILELMAAVEMLVPHVCEEEIAAALRRSAETDTVQSSRDFKLDAVQQIEQFIEFGARWRQKWLQ